MNSFDIVDLDPYGSAIPLLDAGIKGLKNGGNKNLNDLINVNNINRSIMCYLH